MTAASLGRMKAARISGNETSPHHFNDFNLEPAGYFLIQAGQKIRAEFEVQRSHMKLPTSIDAMQSNLHWFGKGRFRGYAKNQVLARCAVIAETQFPDHRDGILLEGVIDRLI